MDAEILADPRWRLNNLYYVLNEDGDKVQFRMRPEQENLYDNMWYKNLIFKARHSVCEKR